MNYVTTLAGDHWRADHVVAVYHDGGNVFARMTDNADRLIAYYPDPTGAAECADDLAETLWPGGAL